MGLFSKTENFEYLDKLIRTNKEIILDCDIKVDGSERLKYEYGIIIEGNDVVIDGKGHTIDAGNKTHIFKIKGKNIILKNLTLKRGMLTKATVFTFKNREKYIKGAGGALTNYGDVTLINCKIINNSARFGAGVNNEESMTIKDCIFKNNFSSREGGAILNSGKLTISNTIIEDNTAAWHGAAISNSGMLKIKCCKILKNKTLNEADFSENYSCSAISNWNHAEIEGTDFKDNMSQHGGVIFNFNEAKINLKDCCFENNGSQDYKSIIENWMGDIKIVNCKFHGNISDSHVILNKDSLNIYNSDFKKNSCEDIIQNQEGGKLTILGATLSGNTFSNSSILNNGIHCVMNNLKLENRIIPNGSWEIKNLTEMKLEDITSDKSSRCMLNEGTIEFKEKDAELENLFDNQGTFKIKAQKIKAITSDFGHLDDLIHKSNSKIIKLTKDYCFNDYELEFYEGGIELDIDDLIIDGNGKTIDGNNISRIFHITGKNVTLNNIVFKNGFCDQNYETLHNFGGAIRINKHASVKVNQCTFKSNNCRHFAGSIYNRGRISINNTLIEKSTANRGGAIYNLGTLNLDNCFLNENASKNTRYNVGGAIYNEGEMHLHKCSLMNNELKTGIDNYGGAIFTTTPFTSELCLFKANYAYIGGAIYANDAKLEIIASEFHENESINGSAISFSGGIIVKNSTFEKNNAVEKGGALSGHDDVEIINSKFIKNNVKSGEGGAIFHSGDNLKITKSAFISNTSKRCAAICVEKSEYNIEECDFDDNYPRNVGEYVFSLD